MRKNKMSITEQIKLLYRVNGLTWILAGVFDFWDNIPCNIINIIALMCSVVILIKVMTSEREMEDEMAEQNLNAAKARTLTCMQGIFCIVIVFLLVTKMQYAFTIDWASAISPMFFLVLGLENLLIGIYFKNLEEE